MVLLRLADAANLRTIVLALGMRLDMIATDRDREISIVARPGCRIWMPGGTMDEAN
jgi:hypothetical protein